MGNFSDFDNHHIYFWYKVTQGDTGDDSIVKQFDRVLCSKVTATGISYLPHLQSDI